MADKDIERAVDEASDPFEPDGSAAPMSEEDKRKALAEVYTAAESALKAAHRAEFNALRKRLAAERGIDWSPRPTAADRAEEQVRRLIAENPELAERLGIPAAASEG